MITVTSQAAALSNQWRDGYEQAVLNYFANLPPYSAAALSILVYNRLDDSQKSIFMCSLLEMSGFNMAGKG